MKSVRYIAMAVLLVTALTVLFAHYLAPSGYEQQFRELPQAGPSAHHPLGTDELGRDRCWLADSQDILAAGPSAASSF